MTAPVARPKRSALRKLGVFLLPVAVTVAADLVTALLRGKPPWALSLLWDVAVAVGKALAVPWATPLWLLLLLSLGTAASLGRILLDFIRARRAPRAPEFHAYVSDVIYDIRWTWRWTASNHIENLTPRCPHDGMRLVFAQVSYAAAQMCAARCEKCGDARESKVLRYANEAAVSSAAYREIERKLATGEWEHVASPGASPDTRKAS